MNLTEAKDILRLVRDGAAQQDLSDDKLALMAEHLSPLPFEWIRQRVRRWMVSPNLDHRGHEVPKFVSDVDSFLDACGVPLGARYDLVRAVEARKRGEMAEMMLDLRAIDELTYVGANDPLPRGVAELLEITGRPLPAGRPVDLALPAPRHQPQQPVRNGAPTDVRDAIKALSTQFRVGARAIVAVQERRIPEIPVELQPAWEKLQVALRAAEIAKQSHAANADEYRQRIAELIEEESPGDLPVEVMKPAAVRLLKALVAYGGDVAAAEVVGEVWGLCVTGFECAPKDRFEGEPPSRVRITLGGETRAEVSPR